MALRNRGGVWHYRFMLQGREYSVTTSLAATKRNETTAQGMEADHRKALLEGKRGIRRIVVREFSDAAKDFLDWAKMEYRAHPNSEKRIATSFASLKDFFGREPVSAIDEARIECYKTLRANEHKVRNVTIRHDLHALSKFFAYAIQQRWAGENPVRNVKMPSDKDAVRMHILSAEEEKQYFNRATKYPNLHDLGRLILNQGMRPDEAISLRKADVDLERGQIHIRHGKTPAARRTLNLTTESRHILGARSKGKSEWIFPSKRKKPSSHVTRVNNAHDELCKKALEDKITFSFVLYDFRHTFATRMAQAGIDLATLAAILGHNSIRIVEKYVHPTAEHQKDAMARYDKTLQLEQSEGQTKQ